ncbi:MAG TPA: beta-ketoacyl synthase N-terminal-like domain-containing protein [Tepidisphaeraceae bacterium]|nr:beta-ketoacyl synthase N-terminal-like domain-containing protein [Tepidisphaeraceae bacterium]
MSINPVITRIGLVTPLGTSVEETWAALLVGRSIHTHSKVPLQTPPGVSRVTSLAIRAAREAVGSADVSDAALVVGTSKGPVESWLKTPSTSSDVEGPVSFGLSSVATDLARELSITGPKLTLSAACASGLHALIRGTMMIQSGEASRVLVVAAEASVHPLFLASFARLGVLPPDGLGCRPFDQSRAGFLMSEAAAAVVLEKSSDAPGVCVDRCAFGADATHLTGMDPEGRMIRHAIRACLGDDPLELIHAHGTGTTVNDPIELSALDDLVPPSQRAASVYSHKGALGHSLGAAGLVSVVLNVMSHRTSIVPPNVKTTDPLPVERLCLRSDATPRPIRRSLTIAAGFGGAIAAVTLRNT